MRDRDWDEVRACFDGDRDDWVSAIMDGCVPQAYDYEVAWLDRDGIPVAIGGYRPVTPAQWTAWLVGTEHIGRCGVEIHHWSARTMQMLCDKGVLRIVAGGMDEHKEGERWLRRLGFRREGVHPFAGMRLETIITWAWTSGMPLPHVRKEVSACAAQ